MADKKPWLGTYTLPTIWIWICVLSNLVGILALIMLVIAEVIIMINDFNNYVDQYGHSYQWTNAPKHLGSAVWMILYQISLVVLATLTIASDLAWRTSSYNEWGGRYVSAFFAIGITSGPHNTGFFYYVIANAFLKLFIVVLYMSQSFYGLAGGSHDAPSFSGIVSGAGFGSFGGTTTTVVVGSTATATGTSGSGILWKRIGPDPNDPVAAYGTELFAQWAGWIVLGSIVPSVIAFMFLVPWAAAKNAGNGKGDAEKGSGGEKKDGKK